MGRPSFFWQFWWYVCYNVENTLHKGMANQGKEIKTKKLIPQNKQSLTFWVRWYNYGCLSSAPWNDKNMQEEADKMLEKLFIGVQRSLNCLCSLLLVLSEFAWTDQISLVCKQLFSNRILNHGTSVFCCSFSRVNVWCETNNLSFAVQGRCKSVRKGLQTRNLQKVWNISAEHTPPSKWVQVPWGNSIRTTHTHTCTHACTHMHTQVIADICFSRTWREKLFVLMAQSKKPAIIFEQFDQLGWKRAVFVFCVGLSRADWNKSVNNSLYFGQFLFVATMMEVQKLHKFMA